MSLAVDHRVDDGHDLIRLRLDRHAAHVQRDLVQALLVAALFGPEFPSILGGIVGLAIVVTAARRGFLLPDEPWTFGRNEPAIFLVVVLVTYWLHGMHREQLQEAFKDSAMTLVGSAIALGAALPMVRIFINSGVNGGRTGVHAY